MKLSPSSEFHFSSDLHLLHKGITKGTTHWTGIKENQLRNFETEIEMSHHIIENLNKKVKPNDVLFLGGDFCFGGHENIPIVRKMINCKNIITVYGNHDEHLIKNTNNYRSLFTLCDNYLEFTIGDEHICMSHYPMYVWNKSHKGNWQLHGHCHNNLNHYVLGKTLDVGIDSYFKNKGLYMPYHFDEIKEYMDNRDIVYIDHHDKQTV